MRHRSDRIDNIELPPAIPNRAIAEAGREYTRRAEEYRLARQDEIELEQTRDQAVEADRQAYADAVEAGKPDPGPKRTKAHDEKHAAAVRRSEAVEIALERSRTRLLEAMDEHRDELRDAAEKRVAQSRAALRAGLDDLLIRHGELQQALALAGWARSFPEQIRWAPGKYAAQVSMPRSEAGQVPAEQLLTALRASADPPPARPAGTMPVPDGPQPLRKVA